MKRQDLGAARRYARALLDLAREKGDPEAVRRELRESRELLESHAELGSALSHPTLRGERRKRIVTSVWGGRVSPLTLRLLELLAERGRFGLLPSIEASFSALWNQERGVVAAEAVSAVTLDPAQQARLREALAAAVGKQVDLVTSLDASLRGGLLVRMEGRTYDGSVRGRLRALRERLVRDAPGAA
jgi:F-type H+-transporting ATPase subunit delta